MRCVSVFERAFKLGQEWRSPALSTAAMRGIRVVIATAGTSHVLPATIATHTDIPVIGVPLSRGPRQRGQLEAVSANAMPDAKTVAAARMMEAQ